MLAIIRLYLDVILSLYKQGKITDKEFYHYADLLLGKMGGES